MVLLPFAEAVIIVILLFVMYRDAVRAADAEIALDEAIRHQEFAAFLRRVSRTSAAASAPGGQASAPAVAEVEAAERYAPAQVVFVRSAGRNVVVDCLVPGHEGGTSVPADLHLVAEGAEDEAQRATETLRIWADGRAVSIRVAGRPDERRTVTMTSGADSLRFTLRRASGLPAG